MVRGYAERIIFWRPAFISVLLHALVVAGMTMNWVAQSDPTPAVKVQPRYVQARLIDASELKPRKKVRKPAPKTVPAAKPVARQATKTASPAKTSKPAVKPRAKPKPEPKPAPVVEADPGPTAEERSALAQQEFAMAMEAEDMLLEQASDNDVAQSYVALISQTVQNNWSRPPSARNGMEAELIIQLIPTGEVVSVTVARSSGQLAFDRSAVNAVQKSERFPELQKLPVRIFEKSFRQFRLLFKPEDLRY